MKIMRDLNRLSYFSVCKSKDHKFINNKHKGLMLKTCPNAFLKGVAMFIFSVMM